MQGCASQLAAAALDEPQGGPNTKGGADPGIDESLYRSLLGRVGRQAGYPLKMLWMAGNPPSPSHWIAKEFGYDGSGEPTNPHPKRRLYLVGRDENRANLHPTYYEDLEEVWGRDTPLARRFLFGEWIEFATEQPFHRGWILFWGLLRSRSRISVSWSSRRASIPPSPSRTVPPVRRS